MTLWHYTCDHGRAQIRGELLPAVDLAARGKRVPWTGEMVWLTDLDYPDRDALGLTMEITDCDRTRHRFRVTDPSMCQRWINVRRDFWPWQQGQVEAVPGALPRHWWVSRLPVPVVYDPPGERETLREKAKEDAA